MLAELAITPHIFDPESNSDVAAWREALLFLRNGLHRSRSTPSALVISGLHADSASGTSTLGAQLRDQVAALRRIEGLPDEIRKLIEDIHGKLEFLMVMRPPCTNYPVSEVEWFQEMDETNALLNIPQGIGSLDGTTPGATPRRPLQAVNDPSFWDPSRRVTVTPRGKTTSDQISEMQTMLTHAQHYIVTIPYVSLRDYLIELLKRMFARPTGFAPPEAHVYISDNGVNPVAWTNGIRNELHKDRLANADRHVVLHYLNERTQVGRERVILGSALRQISPDQSAPSPRFGVSLTHGPEGDPSEDAIATWSLLSLHDVRHRRDLITRQTTECLRESLWLDGSSYEPPRKI